MFVTLGKGRLGRFSLQTGRSSRLDDPCHFTSPRQQDRLPALSLFSGSRGVAGARDNFILSIPERSNLVGSPGKGWLATMARNLSIHFGLLTANPCWLGSEITLNYLFLKEPA